MSASAPNVPTSPVQLYQKVVQNISTNLTQAGHPHSPQQVLPQGASDAVLLRLKAGGIATVDEGVDVLNKIIEDSKGSIIGGFEHNYMVGNSKTGPEIIAQREAQKAA